MREYRAWGKITYRERSAQDPLKHFSFERASNVLIGGHFEIRLDSR
jgi:hypothetical protein